MYACVSISNVFYHIFFFWWSAGSNRAAFILRVYANGFISRLPAASHASQLHQNPAAVSESSVLNCRRQLRIIAQFPSGGLENTGGLSGGNCKANHLENKGRPSLVASMQPSTPPHPQLLPQHIPKSPGEDVQLKGAAAENTGRRIRRRCRLTGSPPLSVLFVPVVSLLLSPSPQIWMSRLLNMRPCIFTCSFDARLPRSVLTPTFENERSRSGPALFSSASPALTARRKLAGRLSESPSGISICTAHWLIGQTAHSTQGLCYRCAAIEDGH